ncbi:unnamed protein product, partial [Heterosigma akashiwo]
MEKKQTIVETRKHPYENNDDYGGEVEISGASKLKITWDPNTRCEMNYDYLKLYKNEEGPPENQIKSSPNSTDGKWTGTTPDCWPSFELTGVNKIVWKWRTDSSNVDWGFRMIIEPTFVNFGNSTQIREKIILADGMVPIL